MLGRRVVFAGLLLVALGGPQAVAVAASSSAPTESAAVPRARTDMEVFMLVRATDDEVAAVRRIVTSSRSIDRFQYLDHEAAYREYQRQFAHDRSAPRDVTPEDLPVSFRLVFRKARTALTFGVHFNGVPGVESVVLGAHAPVHKTRAQCSGTEGDLEIFMRTDAATSEIASVRDTLRADPRVSALREIRAAEAHSILRCLMDIAPGFTTGEDEATPLPVSFRVTLRRGVAASVLSGSYQVMPGVDAVTLHPKAQKV